MRTKKSSTNNTDWMEGLKNAGFTVDDHGPARIRIDKYGCGAVLEKTAAGEPRFVDRPGVVTPDGIAHLLDRGFQKFWQIADRSYPAVAVELKSLHQFERDLRAVMGLTSLYNQSLGTVSSRYVYDRVEGREQPRVHKTFD